MPKIPEKKRMKPGPKPGKKRKKSPGIATNDLDPPAFLTDEGREHWFTYLPELVKAKTLTKVDIPLFANFCEQLAIIDRCQKKIDEWGEVIDDKRGSLKANPAVAVAGRALDRAMRAAQHLGMSPTSRVRQATWVPPVTGGNEKDEKHGTDNASHPLSAESRRARLFQVVK